ncbi:pilus assembly PilX N-terminal domain-containing protein [Candidatus Gracilibacteria bacterium]|nr:pilus assembly PilX N-terminal domain-containing protein [Candidatus Gracilibacteria bacterium]
MNRFSLHFRRKRFVRKSSGAVLFVTLILSALIVTVGIGLAKILATEIQFSSDILFGEKAYFAAESGVEIALREMNAEPVQNIENYETSPKSDDQSAKLILSIQNLQPLFPETSFSLRINPKQTQKLRLRKDTDPSEGVLAGPVGDFDLSVEGGRFQWKFLCQSNNGTISLQNISNPGDFPHFYDQKLGISDDEFGNTTIDKTFSDIGADPAQCFFSLTNLDENNPITVTFANTEMPPSKAAIHSTGKSGGRQKSIVFEYAQKNLSPFFDFGLFHKEGGF